MAAAAQACGSVGVAAGILPKAVSFCHKYRPSVYQNVPKRAKAIVISL